MCIPNDNIAFSPPSQGMFEVQARGSRAQCREYRAFFSEASHPESPASSAAEVEGDFANVGGGVHVTHCDNRLALCARDARIRGLLARAAFHEWCAAHFPVGWLIANSCGPAPNFEVYLVHQATVEGVNFVGVLRGPVRIR